MHTCNNKYKPINIQNGLSCLKPERSDILEAHLSFFSPYLNLYKKNINNIFNENNKAQKMSTHFHFRFICPHKKATTAVYNK